MLNKHTENFLIKTSPHLSYKDENGLIKINNRKAQEWFLFGDKDIKDLLNYLNEPKSYQELAYNDDKEIQEKNKEVIDNLLEWGLVNIDLELKERDCPLCGEKEYKIITEKFDETYDENFTYCECKSCQTIYLNPCPSERAINSIYSKIGYYSKTNKLTDGILQKRIIQKSNRIRTSIIQDVVELEQQKNFLDLGCSTGEFLNFIYCKYKCNVFGLDIDQEGLKELSKRNPQIKTYESKIENFSDDSIQYDVISAWGVIEHLNNPLKLIESSKKILNKNGLLIFDFPNVKCRTANWDIKNWPYLNPPFHINFFDKDNLLKKIKELGLELISLRYDKTGSYLLKYSETILFTLSKAKLHYRNKLLDNIVTIFSQPFIYLESKLKFNSRIVLTIINKKYETK